MYKRLLPAGGNLFLGQIRVVYHRRFCTGTYLNCGERLQTLTSPQSGEIPCVVMAIYTKT